MKNAMRWFALLAGLLVSLSGLAQADLSGEKMPVHERMAKARAAKADKKGISVANQDTQRATTTVNTNKPLEGSLMEKKATPADYTAPVEKSLKGPHGEVVHTGEKGAKYYINKNGNKTYLSSNQ